MAGDPHKNTLKAAVVQKLVKTLLVPLRCASSDVFDTGMADSDDGLVNAVAGSIARAQRRVKNDNFMLLAFGCDYEL
jgi:hypothetical protein